MEKLSTLLMIAGRCAPRYQQMAQLYPRSKALQSHLSEYFIVIVNMCHYLLKMTRKSMFGQLLSSTTTDSEMKTFETELGRWATAIREEVGFLTSENSDEQGTRVKKLLKLWDAEAHRQRLRDHASMLDACSTYDHEETWKEIRKTGNATLFQHNLGYNVWKTGRDSATFLCMGKLGAGKSVLLANIIDDLNLHVPSSQTPVAFFFCRHDISESLKSGTVIGSLARQLLRLETSLSLDGDSHPGTAPNKALHSEQILNLLTRSLPTEFTAYVLLDGLDECNEREINEIVQFLQAIQSRFKILLCVSFRIGVENGLILPPSLFTKPFTLTIPDDNPDVAGFISAQLERSIASGKLKVGDPIIVLEIEDALLQGVQGMFLWVALQIESLHDAKTDEEIRAALANLPKSLPETFERIIHKAGKTGEDQQQRRIFQLIIAARRPLSTEELREALSVTPGITTWNPARSINHILSTLACCGNLVVVEEEHLTVRLVHHSVKQFLLDAFTMDSSHQVMNETIMTYLNYGIFETRVSTLVVPQLSTKGTPSTVINSMDTSASVRNFALKLLRTRRSTGYNMGKSLAEAAKLRPSAPAEVFYFHVYAKAHWLEHVMWTPEGDPSLMDLVRKVSTVEASPQCCGPSPGGERSFLSWAAERGETEIVRAFAGSGAALEPDDASDLTPLCWAAQKANLDMVWDLLRQGADVNYKSKSGITPLLYAAMGGHCEVAEILLEAAAAPDAVDDNTGQSPILEAIRQGSEAMVKLLLHHGASPGTSVQPEPPDGRRWTDERWPLLAATLLGRKAIVELLLSHGASPEPEQSGAHQKTPLDSAVRAGNLEMVRLLLRSGAKANTPHGALFAATEMDNVSVARVLIEHGAQIETRNEDRLTPLMFAARKNRLAMVRMLLQKGASAGARVGTSFSKPLNEAVESGNEDMVQLLLEYARRGSIEEPLDRAVYHGRWRMVKLLITKGASLMEGDQPPLAYAASIGNVAVVAWILESSLNSIEILGSGGRSALSHAASVGSLPVLKLLLERGADVNSLDRRKRTPVSHAASTGRDAAIRLLVDHGARLEMADSAGRLPLSHAAEGGHTATTNLILSLARTNSPQSSDKFFSESKILLACAIRGNNSGMAKVLLERGVALSPKDLDGKTPFWYAVDNEKVDIARLLLERGEDPNQVDAAGKPALVKAVLAGDTGLVSVLLAYDANVLQRDHLGRTLWEAARDVGNNSLADMLEGAK